MQAGYQKKVLEAIKVPEQSKQACKPLAFQFMPATPTPLSPDAPTMPATFVPWPCGMPPGSDVAGHSLHAPLYIAQQTSSAAERVPFARQICMRPHSAASR